MAEDVAQFTHEQVARHCTADDCWIIVSNGVHDITNFLNDHPGGRGVLLQQAGKDCTKEFLAQHSLDYIPAFAPKAFRGVLAHSDATAKAKSKPKSVAKPTMKTDVNLRSVAEAELQKRKKMGQTWIALHGLVYDTTAYLPDHPGGGELIERVAAQDATDEFEETDHSAKSRREPRLNLIGVLEGCEEAVADLRARGWHEGKGIPYPAMLLSSAAGDTTTLDLLIKHKCHLSLAVGCLALLAATWLARRR
mmetsp:Transcript_1264/g.2633  ORF Transcript_1264/g.2633 Transcript_1264/m.2633 type:complete len:250 (+) Transcript_1264:91-840(+)